jgi:two-component sensor histidine kinase
MSEQVVRRGTDTRLRDACAHDQVQALLHEKDELLLQHELLRKESDHRLLNDLQLIVSLLSLQSRNSINAEAASQLDMAANRVNMIVRVHKRLRDLQTAQAIAFDQLLRDLCNDFSTMFSNGPRAIHLYIRQGMANSFPAAIALRLSFIVCELLTNAVKHGSGLITVRLEPDPAKGYELSVTSEGEPLPADFDPSRGKGLGMKIIRSFVAWLGGEFQFGRGAGDRGARFAVLFSLEKIGAPVTGNTEAAGSKVTLEKLASHWPRLNSVAEDSHSMKSQLPHRTRKK